MRLKRYLDPVARHAARTADVAGRRSTRGGGAGGARIHLNGRGGVAFLMPHLVLYSGRLASGVGERGFTRKGGRGAVGVRGRG